jgi:Flp pilus assembly protein TadG
MLWLTSRFSSDRGAVAIIVAMLFGFGVVIACAALTLDVGQINLDRRQLQNGADAAALSAARDCIAGVCPSPTGSKQAQANYARLVLLANNNAADGATKLARVDSGLAAGVTDPQAVCGTLPGLTACPVGTNSSNLQECPAPSASASSLPYVRVYTQTLNASRTQTLLPYSFGAAIAGSGSGANQQACAAVAAGAAGSGPVAFPVTFSYCDWLAQTHADPTANSPVLGTYQLPPAEGLNPGYGAPPNTPWPAAGSEVTLYTQGHSPASCPTWNGHVAPGNFGTLNNISCNASIVNGWVQGDTGNSVPCDKSVLASLIGQIINVPIFDCDTPTYGSFANCTSAHGSGDWYHISGYAAFYLTGYYFSGTGNDGKSIFSGAKPCGGGDRCVSGWFTQDSLQTTIDDTGAPGFGSYVIQLAG